jgi:hypothetical protein
VDVPQTPEDQVFLDYIAKYNKYYNSLADFQLRREIFKRNLVLIQLANQTSENFNLEANYFADMTPTEIQGLFKYTDVPTVV